MVRIAILVLAHKDEKQINFLLEHLSKDFDVYLHIDKKSNVTIKANDNIFSYCKYKVYWGGVSQILATLYLLEKAYRKGYDRYILISGQDLPIVSNKEIMRFFEDNNNEYIDGSKMPVKGLPGNGGLNRITKYWPTYFYRGRKNILLKIAYIFFRCAFEVFSRIFPRSIDYEFWKGSQWVNLTHACVTKIFDFLDKNEKYLTRFKWTSCADEIFFHTIIFNMEWLTVINDDLRYTNWKDGPEHPRTLRLCDYDKICNSGKLFARKFDSVVDEKIIKNVYAKIM